jgi:colanic acid/amylovoran biosynthesis glycosyltransferase
MKIAVILGGFPKISETFILRHITGLLDLGHEVDIFARRNPGEAECQPDVERYHLRDRTQYFDTPTSRTGRLKRAARLFARNILYHPVAMMKCLNVVRYPSMYSILNNVMFVSPFLRGSYDVFLCYWGGNGIDFIILKDVFRQSRFVARFGGDDYSIGDESGYDVFSTLKQFADAFIVQTDYYGRATLQRYGFEDAKIKTLRHVIPVKNINFRERAGHTGRVNILSIARLVEKKGLHYAIKGVLRLQRESPSVEIQYRIIGDGPLRGELELLTQELGGTGTIQFLGAMTSPEVFKWLNESDVFLLPSLMEQAGYVLLEAQSCGLPVIATRVGGVSEMVREGKSAILISAQDSDAIAYALRALIDRSDCWAEMGKEGRAHVEAWHDSEKLLPSLVSILTGVDCDSNQKNVHATGSCSLHRK